MRKRRNSYTVYIIMICMIVLALFYESFQPRNIETVTLISGVGLEKGENKRVKMTIQMIKPMKGDAGSSNSSCLILSGEGDTVAEASENIILKTGSMLFWAHCSIILLNSEFAADENVMPYLDMFFRSSNFRNTASVIVCDESPEEIFNANTVFESISAFGIQRLLDDQDYESNSVYMSLKKFVKNYYMLSSSSVVAGIKTSEVEENSSDSSNGGEKNKEKVKMIELSPCAIMKKGRFISYLSDSEFDGYKWLSDTMSAKIETIDNVNVESENNEPNSFGISLFSANSKLEPAFEDGQYILRVKISVKAQFISVENELQSRNISAYKLERRFDEYKSLISAGIEKDIDSTWQKMVQTESDFCNIQDLFYSKYGNEWKNNRPESDGEMLSNIKLDYNIDVNVVSGGLNKRFKISQ